MKRFLHYITTKFEDGRQSGGYKKLTLFYSKLLKADAYLLYYPEGSSIPPHIDNIESGKHYRLNIEIKRAEAGGIFYSEDTVFDIGRVVLFRPDINLHRVSRINKGSRLVLSFGKVV
ncbi:hypothetical protein PQC39_gp024 [Vibrio phage Vp_R1]|uniref:Fe2OG dioxygenase domain-containing protein n=1 Tax=Vibrio phage Vp_R1 TaxID=2059867 RepID=A0A2H5BPY2_9CAUD|nr:hypothetical protein PQC39_gp024 [Vibrio phage Vp_R1]AUG88388.1 hypothetical protein VPR_024 [Vibrio phage Vp_R1]